MVGVGTQRSQNRSRKGSKRKLNRWLKSEHLKPHRKKRSREGQRLVLNRPDEALRMVARKLGKPHKFDGVG